MTTEEKLLKLRKLADAMYYAAQHLTTDASRLHKAMDEYHKFIINEYHKEEPTIPDIVDEHFYEMLGEEPVNNGLDLGCGVIWKEENVSEDLKEAYESYTDSRLVLLRPDIADMSCDRDTKMSFDVFDGSELEAAFYEGANWQKKQLLANAIDAVVKIDAGGYPYVDRTIELYDYDKDIPLAKRGDKVKILVIKES